MKFVYLLLVKAVLGGHCEERSLRRSNPPAFAGCGDTAEKAKECFTSFAMTAIFAKFVAKKGYSNEQS